MCEESDCLKISHQNPKVTRKEDESKIMNKTTPQYTQVSEISV